MTRFIKLGPKIAGHFSIGQECPVCHKQFEEGDFTSLVAIWPASIKDAQKQDLDKVYKAQAVEVHWKCIPPPFRETEHVDE